MAIRRIISTLVALVIVGIVGAFVLFPLASQGKLPGQSNPTPVPVTPFANLATSSAVGATATLPATVGATATATATEATAPTSAPTTSAGTASAAANTYAITADQSQAKVTVNERLAFLPANTDAVLTTNTVQGQIVLGADGKPTEASKIEVDLRTLKSDAGMRDSYIRQNTLQSDMYPIASFVITGVDGWNGPLQDGQQASFKLLGQMTIHGVTKPATFDTTATMNGNTLTGTATTAFAFEDFGMMPSNKANIVTVNDHINLQMTISAAKSA